MDASPPWADCAPAFRIITDSEFGNNAVELFPCQVCHGFSRKLERASFHNGILMIPRSRAVRLRLMSLTGTEIARLNDKNYRELLSARLEEDRRIQIARRIKEREVEELNRKTKQGQVSSSSEDEANPGGGAIIKAEDMVPEQLKQYLCLDPDERPHGKRTVLGNKPFQQDRLHNVDLRAKDQRSDTREKSHGQKVQRKDRSKEGNRSSLTEEGSQSGIFCKCKSPQDCPVAKQKMFTCASGPAQKNKKVDGSVRSDSARSSQNEVILPHETHRLLSSCVESDDLRGKLDAIQDLDTLYNLADRLLLPPLQFDEDAQEEEPMKLSILENAVFDGNAEENIQEVNSEGELEDFAIF